MGVRARTASTDSSPRHSCDSCAGRAGRGPDRSNLLDAFDRASDETLARVGQEPLFTTNGAGRLRIPILTQSALPFE